MYLFYHFFSGEKRAKPNPQIKNPKVSLGVLEIKKNYFFFPRSKAKVQVTISVTSAGPNS